LAIVSLAAHHATPATFAGGVCVALRRGASRGLSLAYSIDTRAAALRLPPERRPVRADDLWHTTCMEMFLQPAFGGAYAEFNFSPSSAWAAWTFSGYRQGRANLELPPPAIVVKRKSENVRIAVEILLPDAFAGNDCRVGLSAVIEEQGGCKSYWALAHPPGDRPDFHDPACFAASLPARGAP
jgi:hypothetical protein